jgi:hypothetical protein
MKIKFGFLIGFLCCCAGFTLAQTTRLKYIGIEGGISFIKGNISNMDYIRGDVPSYFLGFSTKSLTSLSYKSYMGVKAEVFSLNDHFGLLGGVRFSRMNNSVGKNGYWNSNPNYFYWLYRQDGVNTEYLKVKEINQISDYIGIPVEIRYFPARRHRLFQPFFKVGIELNYLMQSHTGIVFDDPAMRPYQKELASMVEQPGKLSSSLYGGGGIRLGRDQKPSISIEASFPYLILTSGSSGLLHPIYGGGIQFNVQIPIHSKAK